IAGARGGARSNAAAGDARRSIRDRNAVDRQLPGTQRRGGAPISIDVRRVEGPAHSGDRQGNLRGDGDAAIDPAPALHARGAAGAEYPRGRFGQSLQQIAQLIKSDAGVEMAFADIGGWDHHTNELGAGPQQLPGLLREFGASLAAFWKDMGDRMQDIVLVTMSEFGRTARENGNRGTDHGHANCMFVMGGGVKGGKVHGKWPGLEREQLYEGRDLAVTTDFRDVLGELVARHIGNGSVKGVFPGYDPKFLGLLG